MKNKLIAFGVGATAALSSTVALAAVDVSAATGTITTDGSAAISEIGGAMLGLAALGVVFKWAKGAIFG